MKQLAYLFLGLSRRAKAGLLISVDVVFAMFALWVAFSLRLGEWYVPQGKMWFLFLLTPFLAVPIFIKLGLYRAIIRYIGGRALWTVFQAVTLYGLVFMGGVFIVGSDLGLIPRTVPVINWLVFLLFVGGSRFVARWWMSDVYVKLGGVAAKDCYTKKVVIYGAGSAGVQLASALQCGHDFKPVAFIDDDKLLHNQKVNGARIYPMTSLAYLIERHGLTEVFLALPSASRGRRSEIIRLLEPYPVHVMSMPDLTEIAQGKVKVDALQEVDIADLLGRDIVQLDQGLFHSNTAGKVVMVTGAGGSIGSELCRKIIDSQPAKIILFELNEFALYTIDKELKCALAKQEDSGVFDIISILGSVTDELRMKKTCEIFKVQTIYHAAAFKHVPMVEHNPGEAVKNNIFGTLNVAQAAILTEVETVVLISTDKAVRPTNTMGATKRFAELVLQALSMGGGHRTRFTMVRFGNVLESSGSVVPLFREQIAQGGPVTVTDARVIRYFMTISEAAQLVIQAGAMGLGGDVFVLDMGEPIRIVDLAKQMIHLSGLEIKDEAHPDGEVEIRYTGLRPGEKLYEELLIGGNVSDTAHCRIMRAEEEVVPWSELNQQLESLTCALEEDDFEGVRAVLKASVSGFVPQCEVSDFLYQAENKCSE